VLMYVEDGVEVDQAALEQSARQFNDQIYDRNRELFGSEWTPGVDGDPRLTVLNARIPGVGGYFGGSDQVPRSANPFSNEREMFYINIDSFVPGTEGYGSVLAHEFQHMINWHEQDQTSTWLNEGLSQLAEELNGFLGANNLAPAYLYDPDLQLTTWDSANTTPHYAASYLFMSYFYQQYQDGGDLNRLIKDNAGKRLQVFADIASETRSDIEDFGDVYADWSIANLLNDARLADGRYSYAQLPETVEPLAPEADLNETVAQFGSDYWNIDSGRTERVLQFDGSDTIGLVATEPEGRAMWWSNRGDSAHTRLSRTVDLSDASSATLQFRLWYDLEDNYDYGFVSVSTDGGETFETLRSRYTTTDDPQGYNYGNAYTGVSGGGDEPQWIDEQIDLTPYAGQEIVLRWSVISDDAVNEPGMALDDLRIPEIGWSDDAEAVADGWNAEGFVRTDNRLPQQWELRLVREAGSNTTVETVELDAENRAEIRLNAGERGTLVVMATTPHTTERAPYTLTID
jgi:immune inhibitor A